MKRYETSFIGSENGRKTYSTPLPVRYGIMQGDTLSPPLFCCNLIPMSYRLRHDVPVYRMSNGLGISHILYMEDLKIYAQTEHHMNLAIEAVIEEAGAVGLEINPAKCSRCRVKKGRPPPQNGQTNIPLLGSPESYKYLGLTQLQRPTHAQLLDKATDKCIKTIERALRSNLTIRQKVDAINMCAIPTWKYVIGHFVYGHGKFLAVVKKARELDMTTRSLQI